MASYFHHISASTQAPTVLPTFPFSRTPQGAHRDAKQLSCWPAISASLRGVIRSRDPKHSRSKTRRKTPRFVRARPLSLKRSRTNLSILSARVRLDAPPSRSRSQFHHIGASTQASTVLATFPFSRTPQGAPHRDAKQLSCWPAISASLRSVIRSRDPKHSRPKTRRNTPRFVKWATNFRLFPYCASDPTRTALASLGNVGRQDQGPTGHDPSQFQRCNRC